MTYQEFLETKIELAQDSGFVVAPGKINQVLKPHQRDAVAWALKGGRRALFESFGLGKTVQELEFCHLAAEHEKGRALIVLPLGVKQEFTRDAVEILGYERPTYCRTMDEVKACDSRIVLTNYERVRDGDIDPSYFVATQTTVADELKENLEAVENFKGSRDEKLVVLYCKQLGINYKNLSDEEFRWLIRILKKSKKMGTPISQRKKR